MNGSGIYPKGQRVLIRPDRLKETMGESRFIVPDHILEQHDQAAQTATLVAVGDDAWTDYAQPFAQIGQRIMFAKFSGLNVPGKDGEEYRVINDTDITATIDDEVHFDILMKREPLSGAG